MEHHLSTCSECRELVSAMALGEATRSLSPPASRREPIAVPVGTVIGGFRVEARLGQGAMGDVYLARDTRLDRPVALKLLAPGTGTSPERWLREGRAQALLSHPNVVAVYEAFTWEDRVVLALEFIEGRTLRRWLADEKPPWRVVLDALLAAGDGLVAAHKAGLVHRDFKPDNVLVGSDGRVRVADFGLAAGDLQAEVPVLGPGSTTAGTPAYMAPEQFLHGSVGAEADQFSFCVTLFEALYGRRPFWSEHTPRDPRAAAGLGPDHVVLPASKVPSWVWRRLRRGLSARPEQRYPSLAALLVALRRDPRTTALRLAVGATVVVIALSGWGPWRRWDRVSDCTSRGDLAMRERWNAGVRSALLAPTRSSRLPPIAADELESYADAWRKAWSTHCASTERDLEHDAQRTGRCLDHALSEFGATTALLAHLDRTDVTSLAATRSLAEPNNCLLHRTTARQVEAMSAQTRDQLSEATALLRLGQLREARPRLETLASGLMTAPASRAEVLAELARASRLLGDFRAAREHTSVALRLAAEARDEVLVARLWIERVALVERSVNAPSELAHSVEAARLAIIQAGGGRHLETTLASAHAATLLRLRMPREARAVLEQGLDASSLDEAERQELTAQLAAALGELGESQKARETAEQALELARARLGDEHPLLAPAWKLVSNTSRSAGAHERAIAAARVEQRLLEAALGADHPSLHAARLDEAHALWVSGNAAASEPLARASYEALSRSPDDWLQAARALNMLGVCRTLLGDTSGATEFWRRAVTLLEAHEGTTTVLYGAIVANLGGNLMERRSFTEAEALLTRALSAHDGGEEPVPPLSILSQLGTVQLMAGRLGEAQQTLERALSQCEASPEHRCEGIHGNLGRLLVERGQLRQALPELELGLTHATRDEFDKAIFRFYRARVRWDLGLRTDALEDARDALAHLKTTGARGALWREDVQVWLTPRSRP